MVLKEEYEELNDVGRDVLKRTLFLDYDIDHFHHEKKEVESLITENRDSSILIPERNGSVFEESTMHPTGGALSNIGGKCPQIYYEVHGRTVEEIRKMMIELRALEGILFNIHIESMKPVSTPESIARMGVELIKMSAFNRTKMVISLLREDIKKDNMERPLHEIDRLELIKQAITKGFGWVKLEEGLPFQVLLEMSKHAKKSNSKLLFVQYHRPGEKWEPPEISKIPFCDAFELRSTVNSEEDLVRIFTICDVLRQHIDDKDLIVTIEGPYSHSLDIMSAAMGSSFIRLLEPTRQPGQKGPTSEIVKKMVKILGISREYSKKEWSILGHALDENMRVCFVVGKYSDTLEAVIMSNSEARRTFENIIFAPLMPDPGGLEPLMEMMRKLPMNGMEIDVPFKTPAVKYVDEVRGIGEKIQSINLVMKEGGLLYGYNTESATIEKMLEEMDIEKGKRALVIGSGSTGRSIAAGLHEYGCRVLVMSRNNPSVEALLNKLGKGAGLIPISGVSKLKGKVDLVLKCTPSDMVTDETGSKVSIPDIVREIEPERGIDICANEEWTPFLSSVESRGGIAVPGREFLLLKRAITYRMLTGQDPDLQAMQKAMEEFNELK